MAFGCVQRTRRRDGRSSGAYSKKVRIRKKCVFCSVVFLLGRVPGHDLVSSATSFMLRILGKTFFSNLCAHGKVWL